MRSFVTPMLFLDLRRVTLSPKAGLTLCVAALFLAGCGAAAPKSVEHSIHDGTATGAPPPPPPPPDSFMRVGSLVSPDGAPDTSSVAPVKTPDATTGENETGGGGKDKTERAEGHTETTAMDEVGPRAPVPAGKLAATRGKSSGSVQGAVVDTQSSISEDDVRTAVNQRGGSFRRCYDLGISATPGFSGSVTVRIAVSPAGSVASVELISTTTKNQQVDACVSEEVKRLMFPSNGGGAVVAFPIEFGQ